MAESTKRSSTWHLSYELPELPKTILNLMKNRQKLSVSHQDQIITLIYESMAPLCNFYAKGSQYDHVIKLLLNSYPALSTGNTMDVSMSVWKSKLQHKFKNRRNIDGSTNKFVVARKKNLFGNSDEEGSKSKKPKHYNSNQLRPSDSWGVQNYLPLLEQGEDEQSMLEYKEFLRKMHKDKNPDLKKVTLYMDKTFPDRRKLVVTLQKPVLEVASEYPWLRDVDEMECEFYRILGDKKQTCLCLMDGLCADYDGLLDIHTKAKKTKTLSMITLTEQMSDMRLEAERKELKGEIAFHLLASYLREDVMAIISGPENSPKGKPGSGSGGRKRKNSSPTSKNANQTSPSSSPKSGNETRSPDEGAKALRMRSCSNESTAHESSKKRSASAESASTKAKMANVSKIIDQVIESGTLVSSKKSRGSSPLCTTPKKDRGRPPKKEKVPSSGETSAKTSSCDKPPAKKAAASPSNKSGHKAPHKSPNNERNKSTSVSPRRLKKAASEAGTKTESAAVKHEEGAEESKVKALIRERFSRSIERVIASVNRDDYRAFFAEFKAKEIPKFKNFKKPKNHIIKKASKEKPPSATVTAEDSSSPEADVKKTEEKTSKSPCKEDTDSASGNDLLSSPRKRGRPKGSKNKIKWDEHGNKIISKNVKKNSKKSKSAEKNEAPKLPCTKMEGKNVPIKKRDYHHMLSSSAEDELDSSTCTPEKKKPSLKVKSNKPSKKIATKPFKVVSTKVSKNKTLKLKKRLKPILKTKKAKVLDIKSDGSTSESDAEDKKYASTQTSKLKFTDSRTFTSDSEPENDSKVNIKTKKKLITKAIKPTKKVPVKEKKATPPKVKPSEKSTKGKNVVAKREIMSDSMSGSDFEEVKRKPPKKALKDKWSREERRSLKPLRAAVKVEEADSVEEKSPQSKSFSFTREKKNRMYYFEDDESDLEIESSDEDDDGDELYVSTCNTSATPKRFQPSSWKMKKSGVNSAPPKRAARMASLNAIAMMACMNEDAKVPLSSLAPPCKEPPSPMQLVVKESTIARIHSDVDDDSDSDEEPLPPPIMVTTAKRKREHLAEVIPKRRKRRRELDVQMDMKDMVVTKRMASLNASAIMAASYSLESRSKKVPQIVDRESRVTNVDIQQKISFKSTKSQSSNKTRSVITVKETTKKVKKAHQGSRETEVEEHIIVKKVKRQSGVDTAEDTDRDEGNATDNSELDHEILPKTPDDAGMIVESTITYVTTQTHTAPQSVTLSGVSKYCISSTDGKTTTVVQQVQRKSTTTTNAAAPPTSASTIPTAHIPPNQHVQVPQSENNRQIPRGPTNYSPLGALEVMQPTMHPSHPPHPSHPSHPPTSHFMNYTPPHHHLQHGIPVATHHLPHHPHHPPPHIAHHHHIATSPYPPLSPHSPPYPPPPSTPSSTTSSSPVCSTTPPSTVPPPHLVPTSQSCHPPANGGRRSPTLLKANSAGYFRPTSHVNNMPNSSESSKNCIVSSTTPSPPFRDERGRPPISSSAGQGLSNGPSERHHSAFTAPTLTHSPGYQPVSGPMPMGGSSSANGSYKPHQASPGSTPPYSSPSRLTSPPPPSNKVYQPPNPDHYPPHPYQPYPYPPSSYDKYYHPRATAYMYQSPYPGGQYMGEQGSPEYSFHPPPAGTVHYSQESYTSYTLCVPAPPPPPHGASQLPPHPQTLALPSPPTSNASPHHHQAPPYATYQYTEFNPGYPYPPAGPPPNPGCCPPNPKNVPSGSLMGVGKGPEGDCRGKNQAPVSGSCNNYQYYNMPPRPSHPSQQSGYQHPMPAHNAMSHGHHKQYHYPQVESHIDPHNHNHQPTSVAQSSCNMKNKSSDTPFMIEGPNKPKDSNANSLPPLPPPPVPPTVPPPVPPRIPSTTLESQLNNKKDTASKSCTSTTVTLPFSTSSSLSTSTSVSSSQVTAPLLSIVVSQSSVSPSVSVIPSSEPTSDTQSAKESKDDKQSTNQHPKLPTSSACGKNEAVVPNGKSTLQITTWVVPPSASPVATSSNSRCTTGVSQSHNMLFSPTSTTTSISLPHPFASTNSVMSTTVPVVTSLEKFPLDNCKPKTSISSTNSFNSTSKSGCENKDAKTNSTENIPLKDQTAKKVLPTSMRAGSRHLLCQPLPLNHSKTTSVLAKVKPSTIKNFLPLAETKISVAQHKSSLLNDCAPKFAVKLSVPVSEAKSHDLKCGTDPDSAKEDECPVVPRKRGRPPKIKELMDGISTNGVTLETKPFLQAPGDVNSREDKEPRKRMSLLKSSGAKNPLAVHNSILKKPKPSPTSQDIPLIKRDLKPDGDMKMINVKTEALGKIKAEKVSPKNVALKDSGRLKFINEDDYLKPQVLPEKEFKGQFMPPPLGFDSESQVAFENKISKLKSEEIEQVVTDSDKVVKRKSNEIERQGSKSPPNKSAKTAKVISNRIKDPRIPKHGNKLGLSSKVRHKASLLAYLKERSNESDTSLGDTDCPPSPTKEGKISKPHPFVNYSLSPGSIRGRRTSGTGKGKQIRKLKPYHGWTWDGEAHEGKVWFRNDEENMVRTCYKAMKHKEGDMIRVRDCVLLRSGMKKTDLPYIAKVAALWEDPDTSDMMMSILWYYRPEHTESGRRVEDLADEIFASKHRDHLSVACIEDRCYVLTFNEYCRYRRLLRLFQEKVQPTSSPVPEADDGYFRKERQPSGCVVQDLLFFCRKVYDYRQKRILKNPC